jgi:hypothetical protein
LSRKRRNEILAQMRTARVAVRTLPSVTDLAQGKVSISDLRELDIDDLLGREPVIPNHILLNKNIVGKVEHAWLTDEEFAHLRAKLRSIKRYLDARRTRRDGALYMTAFFMLPVARSRGAVLTRKNRT